MSALLTGVHCLVACALLSAGDARADDAATAVVTQLQVSIVDEEQDRPRCEGVRPRRIDVLLDGNVAGHAAIPCTTVIRAPAQRFDVAVAVPPGRHRLRILDRRSRRAATLTASFPTLVPIGTGSAIADALEVVVGAAGVKVGTLGLSGKFL